MKKQLTTIITLCCLVWLASACRENEYEEQIIPSTGAQVTPGVEGTKLKGFFLLNEGNMGSNKASLDYFDYGTGRYTKNLFAERNPNVVKELGDVGNDIQIYGNKLYAVINCSHFVEVMDAQTARHLAVVSIPNCRYITFAGKYAYVSSYAGPVQIDPNARLGYVAKIDTTDFRIVATCVVGYQPEELVVVDNKLYVANSGGYRVPDYDNTLSVIDLETFTETKKIEVGINLHRLEKDNYGYIYVSSRGDYYGTPSKTFILNTRTEEVSDALNPLPCSNMTLCGDHLYLYSTEWSYVTNSNEVSYAIVDTKTRKVITRNFITDGTEKKIKIPYGLAVNPESGEIFVTDAGNYVTPGTLYCFRPDGTKKWEVETGDIPAHITFTTERLKDQ
ncbi:MAG: YncE family protein [Bacteroides sp.]|uniref:YncE family protein n=1 Tax=Bacteroides sp. TaxID=29523 RepID=UPI002FC72243